ncbi:hypothetical protein PO878_20990 [Iamia majanohamensis]|uniref:Anti-sigma factor n=1 Tax=Iamia majanohamensis TaxID=467976 RepID=A0AAE9Y9Q5_9ACTN|nr:hypothetical protein [Iamia majanohamensis]WCO66974.1 hypothetical protein PO878_20990 [Iamia majanohamensis]
MSDDRTPPPGAEGDEALLDALGRALAVPVPPADPDRAAHVARLAADAAPAPVAAGGPADPSRRRLLWMGAAAAGGVAAGVTGAVLLVGDDGADEVPTEAVGTLTTTEGVAAEARLIDHTWGLEVLLDVSGLEPGTGYAMTYVDRSDRPVEAGGFVGTDGLMRCRTNGAVLRSEVARFEVTAPDGAVVVRGDLA